jgi:hypothetical protein
MYYLKVAHVDDNDADYFSFSSIDAVIRYLYNEELLIGGEWQLSSVLFEEMPEQDYTYIE